MDIPTSYHTSKEFKTHAKYGYQPVIHVEGNAALLQFYVENLRVQAVQYGFERSPQTYEDPGYLFLTSQGEPMPRQSLTHMFTAFFKKGNLHINTTTVRSLVETTAEQMKNEGKISAVERAAERDINGHSSAVTRDYYRKINMRENVQLARNISTQGISSTVVMPRSSPPAALSPTVVTQITPLVVPAVCQTHFSVLHCPGCGSHGRCGRQPGRRTCV